ncbi:hypothetical protein NPA31_011760 [Aurantimonas sp. MSK8Z-1]|uniref:hypothetical protein n=1 Tax=Mangrovibrevibacter kandeliae TaxID=2968473 RepID=UPI00211855CC|nr:hypothetical protein [Aurantimonas sp. MSK8Z-1]MCW4115639.1 hypothetical protein [Aurantimonas sp. MSK8Z-1]
MTRAIVNRLWPELAGVITGPRAKVVQGRINAAVNDAINEMFAAAQTAAAEQATVHDAAMRRSRATMHETQTAALDDARRDEREQCRALREADATAAELDKTTALAAARATADARLAEALAAAQTAADTRQTEAVAAAVATAVANGRTAANARQADAVSAASAAATAAERAAGDNRQSAAVAAARTSERAKCVEEIAVAPVSGITVALSVFAASMRNQIKQYVMTGPH